MADYEQASLRAEALVRRDPSNVNQLCRTSFLDHGHPATRSFLLLHGLTSCPHQFVELARLLFEAGHNVLVPRYPHHGLRDRMTRMPASLVADRLTDLARESTDIAGGLGERTTVIGFSLGGVLAAWIGSNYPIDLAVLVSPAFGIRGLPVALNRGLIELGLRLPNFHIWWDPRIRARFGPRYGYPRFSSRALVAMLQVASEVWLGARARRPRAKRFAVLTNANEPAVSNAATFCFVEAWRAHGMQVDTDELNRQLRLPHDVFDPTIGSESDLVYAAVLSLLGVNCGA